jgi:Tetratricopeptide repeat
LLSRDEFDALEYDAACTGDHQTAALRMSELADTGTATATMPRSEAYLRAGEQWLLADDPAQAATGFRRAMADGGPVFADARVPLARALFQLGRQAEAQALISRLKAEGPKDARVCDLVAELLLERNDLIGALDWATAGVELCLGRAIPRQPAAAQPVLPPAVPLQVVRGDDAELRLLLSLRYRIRNDLGLPEDSYDELLDDND